MPSLWQQIRIIDKDIGMYLVDGALGKPKQKQEIDITQTIQFDATQIEQVIKDHLPRIVEMCGPEIRGLLPSGTE